MSDAPHRQSDELGCFDHSCKRASMVSLQDKPASVLRGSRRFLFMSDGLHTFLSLLRSGFYTLFNPSAPFLMPYPTLPSTLPCAADRAGKSTRTRQHATAS